MVIGAIVLLAIVAVYPGRAVAEAASIDAVIGVSFYAVFYAVSGFPVIVHLKGFAIVSLK